MLILSGMAAMTVMLSGCVKDNEPETITDLSVTPETVELTVGETAQLNAVFEPSDLEVLIEWSSEDSTIASVSADGLVEARSAGETIVTASVGEISAGAVVKVSLPDPELGDYFYSDGTWSSEADPEKTVIGVVFWLGDPAQSDAALKADFPECTHGLVVAAGGDVPSYWQSQSTSSPGTVGEWITDNAPELLSVTSGTDISDPLNLIRGYNNTKALELYNAAPENSEWPVEVMDVVSAYREEVPAPANTSGWYLPSMKELSLLCSGELGENVYDISGETSVRDMVNERLEAVNGIQIGEAFYWSSTENSIEHAFDIDFSDGSVWMDLKFMNDPVRCVLAF